MKGRIAAAVTALAVFFALGSVSTAEEPGAHLAAAKALAAEGNYEGAVAELDRVISGYPATDACDEAHLLKGTYLEKLERFEEARDEYRTLISQAPEGKIGQEVAERFARLHPPKVRPFLERIDFLKSELERNPSNKVALRATIRLLQVSNRIASMEERQQAAQMLAGLGAENSELEGASAEAVGRVTAVATLENALAEFGDSQEAAWVKLRLGLLYSTDGPCAGSFYPDQAVEMYRQIIAAYPESPAAAAAHLRLAGGIVTVDLDIRERMDHFMAALSLLTLEQIDREVGRLNGIVATALARDESEAALDFLDRIIAAGIGSELRTCVNDWRAFIQGNCALSDGSDPQLIALGREYSSLHDFDRAIACADEVLRRNPERTFFISAKLLKRGCYRTQQRLEDALRMALDVVEAFPDEPHGDSMMHVVWLYRLLGRHEEALAWAEKVIRTLPGTQWEALGLNAAGKNSAELGNSEAAASLFQQVVDRFPGTHYALWAELDMRRLER